MLYAFVAGFGLLVALILAASWFSEADPKAVLRALKWLAGGVIFGAFVLLLVTGRLGWALAALVALVPWIGRLINLILVGRIAHRTFGGGRNPFGGLGGGSGGGHGGGANGESTVSSRYLDMRLNHANGTMDGHILDGPMAGRTLSSLSAEDAVDLWRQVQDDADSVRLLEAWLDRTYADWREAAAGRQDDASTRRRRASSTGTMSRQEALEILGLEDGATPDQIRAAYRRLMAQAHPDRGGSTWIAAKLNEARGVLLDTPP